MRLTWLINRSTEPAERDHKTGVLLPSCCVSKGCVHHRPVHELDRDQQSDLTLSTATYVNRDKHSVKDGTRNGRATANAKTDIGRGRSRPGARPTASTAAGIRTYSTLPTGLPASMVKRDLRCSQGYAATSALNTAYQRVAVYCSPSV